MPKVVDHEARRRELADAVLDVIAREGTAAVTLRGVAQASGWSTGTLNHYAKNRDGLLKLALQRAASFTRKTYLHGATGDDAGSPFARLERMLSETLPLDERRLALTRIFAVYLGDAVSDPALGEELRQYMQNWRQDVATELERLVRAGHVSADIDVVQTANTLVALADGYGNQAAIDPTFLEDLRSAPPVDNWIRFVLNSGGNHAARGIPVP